MRKSIILVLSLFILLGFKGTIFAHTYGTELVTTSNAVKPSGIDSNAIINWETGNNLILSATTTASDTGTYHLIATATTTNQFFANLISTNYSLQEGIIYELNYRARLASGTDVWTCGFQSSKGIPTVGYNVSNNFVDNADAYESFKEIFIKNNSISSAWGKYFSCVENNAANAGTIYFDTFSIKPVTEISLGAETNTLDNAAAPGNTGSNTTGFVTVSNGRVAADNSVADIPDGPYAIKIDTSVATNNAEAYIDLAAAPFSLVNGTEYFIRMKVRHLGSGANWQFNLQKATGIASSNVYLSMGSATSTMTGWQDLGYVFTYNANLRYLVFSENGASNDGGLYVDKISIKPTTQAAGITISAIDANANEDSSGPATFRIACSPDCTGQTINLTIGGTATNGTDYATVDSTVTITGASQDITITPTDDDALESPETVSIGIASGDGYTVGAPASAEVMIYDNDDRAETFYVRPVTGTYGTSDGTSYDNAFDGFDDISWGNTNGSVGPGDKLFVCGTFNGENFDVGASGTMDYKIRIYSCTTANGASTNDAGIIWGSSLWATDGWTGPDGNGVYSRAGVTLVNDNMVVDSDFNVLYVCEGEADEAACVAANNNSWSFTSPTFYYHPSANLKNLHFNSPGGSALDINEKSYIEIKGLTIYMGTASDGAVMIFKNGEDTTPATDITIASSTIGLNPAYAIRAGGNGSDRITISDNVIFDSANGYSSGGGDDVHITNNEFYQTANIDKRISNHGPYLESNGDLCAISTSGAGDNWIITGNYIHGWKGEGIYMYMGNTSSGLNALISRNRVLMKSDPLLYNAGILMNGGGSDLADRSAGAVISYNIITGNGLGVDYTYSTAIRSKLGIPTDTSKKLKVYNNTIDNNYQGFFGVLSAPESEIGVDFKNNIISNVQTNGYFVNFQNVADPSEATFDYNDYYGTGKWKWDGGTDRSTIATWRTDSNQDSHSITTDPKFVSATDYNLQTGSPAIDTGLDVGLSTDYAGNPLIGSPDLGAYEYLSSTKTITAFSFSALLPAVTGIVNEAAHTISLTVPYGTIVTALVPTIANTGSSVSPNTGVAQDFTRPVTYIVTAADATTQAYTVTVNVMAPSLTSNGSRSSVVGRVQNLLAMGNKRAAEELMKKWPNLFPTKGIMIPAVRGMANKESTKNFLTRSWSFGQRGNEVKQIQQFLNTHGFTVAKSGPGSPGKETTIFGNATKAAVVRFQKANKISPIGIVGPATRKAIEAKGNK
jgi:peptidoglycan hydrolase-like protein with peptidoglycan-binding domain